MKFTTEEECNNQLSFLDVTVYRTDEGKMGTKVYRKSTHTNRYLNFASFHPKCHKISVVDSLITRALAICDNNSIKEELDFVTQQLMRNGYPKYFIKKRIDIQKGKCRYKNNQSKSSSQENAKRAILPYYGSVTDDIAAYIRDTTELELGYYPVTKISRFLNNYKDKLPKTDSGIYKIECEDCPAIYVGETGRGIQTRADEHRNHITNGNVKASAVANHVISENHRVNLKKITMIERESNYFRRKIKESLYIRKSTVKMNQNNGIHINPIWIDILIDNTQNP